MLGCSPVTGLFVAKLVVSLNAKEVELSIIPLVRVVTTVEERIIVPMHPNVPSCTLVMMSERLAPLDTIA